jgi:hypothetical protein
MISRLSNQINSNVGPREESQTNSQEGASFVGVAAQLPTLRGEFCCLSRSIYLTTQWCRHLARTTMIPPLLRLRPAMSSTFSNVNTTIPSANEMPPPSYTVHGTMLPDECADTNWDFQRDHLYRAQNSCLAWSFGAHESTNESRSEVRA